VHYGIIGGPEIKNPQVFCGLFKGIILIPGVDVLQG
jgi:hypothetical protein